MKIDEQYTFGAFHIPIYMVGAIERYINQGIPPGDFLTAIICNDLKESVARADDENMANLPAYVAWFYNEAPVLAWGSRERMQTWISHEGLAGFNARKGYEET